MSTNLITKPLLGLDFDYDRQNCYHTVRGFFHLNTQVRLQDWACPMDWWQTDLDIFRDIAGDEGFKLFSGPPSEYRTGDVPLMALGSTNGNHIGVILPGNRLLHHLWGHRSAVQSYGGIFRNNTVAVYRHPDVSFGQEQVVSLASVLRPYERSKLEKFVSR